jgi:hypothetical protein
VSLWWLQPGWTQTKCSCGATIWPEGDPDWGACYSCFSQQQGERDAEQQYYEELERQSAESTWQMYAETQAAMRGSKSK